VLLPAFGTKVPAGAMEQSIEPAELNLPAMQLEQSVALLDAATVPNVPAAHWVQEAEPLERAYDPGRQLVHSVAPAKLKEPARHDGHEEPDLYVPGAQLVA